jgi:hypothetical protein
MLFVPQLRCASDAEAEAEIALCDQVVACLESSERVAPPYASAECEATAAGLHDLAAELGDPAVPAAASTCDALEGCEETLCRAEVASEIRQWDCSDHTTTGSCICVARPIVPASPLVFAAGNGCAASDCCFAISAAVPPLRRPIIGCGCIGGVDAEACALALEDDPERVRVDSCPPLVGCSAEGGACEEQGCCSGLSCRADASGQHRCQAISDAERWQEECSALGSNRAFDEMRVASATLSTDVGRIEFDRVDYSVLETGRGECLKYYRIALRGGEDNADCSLGLEVEPRGDALAVTLAAGFLGGCPGYTGGLLNDLYSGGLQSGVAVTFAGTTCPVGGIAAACLSGRFDFHFSGLSGSNPEQSVTFSDSHIIIEGTDCGTTSFGPCGEPE